MKLRDCESATAAAAVVAAAAAAAAAVVAATAAAAVVVVVSLILSMPRAALMGASSFSSFGRFMWGTGVNLLYTLLKGNFATCGNVA